MTSEKPTDEQRAPFANELLCTECGKPIEPIGEAVALRFTAVHDKARWTARYAALDKAGAK